MNVALYNPRRWAMTERGRGALARDADRIEIGASAMRWDGTALTIAIDEVTVPLPSRLRGEIVLRPRGLNVESIDLDAGGRHRWRPIAPLCDVSVRFASPDLAWDGTGYFDTNNGDEPLEAAFKDWTWSRFDAGDEARIFYDMTMRDGGRRQLSLAVRDGLVRPAPALSYHPLPTTGWRIRRDAPGEGTPAILKTLEDAPFYARTALRSRIDGRPAHGVHEALSLTRLVSPAVRFMLPFKMPRRG